jgi:hypothetical protein
MCCVHYISQEEFAQNLPEERFSYFSLNAKYHLMELCYAEEFCLQNTGLVPFASPTSFTYLCFSHLYLLSQSYLNFLKPFF